jgi:flagellin
MVSPINNNLTGLVFEATNNKTDLENIVAKLSSGKKNLRVGEDSGAHSQGKKLSSKNVRDIANVQNLQNFLSFTQSQDGVLDQVGKILHRMDEITTRALDITATDDDRENYNKEFLELADQLSKFAKEKFGDINLFGGGTAGIDYIKGTDANDFNYVQNVQNIGTSGAGTTDTGSVLGDDVTGSGTPLTDTSVVTNSGGAPNSNITATVDEDGNPTGAGIGGGVTAAGQTLMNDATNWIKDVEGIIQTAYGWTVDTSDGWRLQINENGQPGGWAAVVWGSQGDVDRMEIDLPDATSSGIEFDRVIAHEMVHVMQHQNTYSNDPTGDGSSRATWLSEGLAEFIHGSDERVYGILGNDPSDDDIRELLNAVGTGNEDWTANDQYAAAYLAVRFLDSEIKEASFTHTTTTGNFTNNDGIKHLTAWMKDQFDLNAGAANSGLNAYISTFLSDKEYSNNDEFINYFKGATEMDVAIDGDGATYKSKAVSSITISDTTSYNLTSIEKAKDTLTFLSTKLTALAEQRALVGANTSRVQNELQNLSGKISTGEMAVSRIEDADIARESSNYASTQVRTQASIAILAQAKQLNVGISDLLRGVNIGG